MLFINNKLFNMHWMKFRRMRAYPQDMLEGRGSIVVTKRNGAKARAALDCAW